MLELGESGGMLSQANLDDKILFFLHLIIIAFS